MTDDIKLGDFIYRLRKDKGYSQTELADKLGVSYKAVSKWETNEAMPKLARLRDLAAVFGISVDELINCRLNESGGAESAECGEVDEGSGYENCNILLGLRGKSSRSSRHYEFVSDKRTKGGLPYVHINFGMDDNGRVRRAKGVFAAGIISRGIVSLGIISLGVVSLGIAAFGIIAAGVIALGLVVAVGSVAAGLGVSVGAVAVGALAVGGMAAGVLSVGGLSIGVYAHTGEFGRAIGLYTYYHLFAIFG